MASRVNLGKASRDKYAILCRMQMLPKLFRLNDLEDGQARGHFREK